MPYNYVFFQTKYWDTCEEESISDNYCLTVEEVLHDNEDGTLVFFRLGGSNKNHSKHQIKFK